MSLSHLLCIRKVLINSCILDISMSNISVANISHVSPRVLVEHQIAGAGNSQGMTSMVTLCTEPILVS